MYEPMSFIAICLLLAITTSFFRFNQNEIDILNQKCNRLVFLLFQNDGLTKNKLEKIEYFFGKNT
jgi:hypothetical protein